MRALPTILPALLLASLAAAQSPPTMPLPSYDVADAWTYETHLFADQVVNATATTRVAGMETVQVGGQPHPAYRLETVHEGARSGEVAVTWLRVEDLAKLKVGLERPGSERTYTAQAPCREWRFPMRPGDEWTTACTFSGDEVPFTIEAEWTVAGAEPVTTPAGAFQALVLEQRGSDFLERFWFAPAACGWVRHDSLDGEGNLLMRELLTGVEGCEAADAPPTGTTPSTPTPGSTRPSPPTASTPGTDTSPGGTTPPPSRSGGAEAETPGAGTVATLGVLTLGAFLLRRR